MSGLVDFKPRLTDGFGRRRAEHASDAPRALSKLALTQAPAGIAGNAQRGAWARGWCDGARRRSSRRNPYRRAGSGFHHGMARLYDQGWRDGRDVASFSLTTVSASSVAAWHRWRELSERVAAILAKPKP